MDQRFKQNVISLTVLQMGNYLVPLAVLPYLTRVLGVEGFGEIGFATAFTMYFVLLVDWGFNLSSTRDIAILRTDRIRRSIVFWETISARVLLTITSAIFLLTLICAVPKLGELSELLCLGMFQVLAAALSPGFYYQGIEKIGKMALINLCVRLSSIPLIILLVRRTDDVSLAFSIQTCSFLVASLVNLWLLLKTNEIAWIKPRLLDIWRALANSFPLFLSSAGTGLYTNSNAVILGFVATEAMVGYFVAGFTLVKAVVGLSGPFAQAVFPRISYELYSDGPSASGFIGKAMHLQWLLGLALSIALLVFFPWGVTWFYGEAFTETGRVVACLIPLPLIVCLASGFGMQILVPLGKNRWFSGVLLLSGVLNCLLMFPMGYMLGAIGAAITVLVTECVIMFGMGLGVRKLAPQMWYAIAKKP